MFEARSHPCTVSLAIATTTIKCFGVMIGLQLARNYLVTIGNLGTLDNNS